VIWLLLSFLLLISAVGMAIFKFWIIAIFIGLCSSTAFLIAIITIRNVEW